MCVSAARQSSGGGVDIANTIARSSAKPSGPPRNPQAVPSMPMKPPTATIAPISAVAWPGTRCANCTAAVIGAANHNKGAIWRSLPRAGETWSPMLRISMPTEAEAATIGPAAR